MNLCCCRRQLLIDPYRISRIVVTDCGSESCDDEIVRARHEGIHRTIGSLVPAYITISDEQYPKIASTGEERHVKAAGDSGGASRSSSYVVSRAQAAYSQAQTYANSSVSSKSSDEVEREAEKAQDSCKCFKKNSRIYLLRKHVEICGGCISRLVGSDFSAASGLASESKKSQR